MENLTKLFEEIAEIRKKAKRKDEFNPFVAIGMNSKEIMHSNFISFLLNPKANHNQREAFLNLFLQEITIELTFTKAPKVCTEKGIKNNRRIDIVIEHSRDVIIIENKFWAADQDKQLEDYYSHYLNQEFDNIHILYLTPYGKSPTHSSVGENLRVGMVKCISYEKHILGWLKKCSEITEDIFLKGSIEKYAELVEKVINRDRYMKKIMSFLFENPDKMELAIDIIKTMQGRNFLEVEGIRENFKDQIRDSVNRIEYIEEWESQSEKKWDECNIAERGNENNIIGSICITDSQIYVKVKNTNPNEIIELKEFTINCDNINYPNLQYLLIQDQGGVDNWVRSIYERLYQIYTNSFLV